ncbi:MAG: FAD:protein FMN transferase, partial [Verrucomicrobiota bacterium]
MKPLSFIIRGLWCCVALPASAAEATAHERLHVFHHENVLGTSLELKVLAASPGEAGRAEAAALAEIDRLAHILSCYETTSEVNRWLHTSRTPVAVSAELYAVLGLFDQWCERSDGALNAAAAIVCQLWQTAAAQDRLPEPAALAAALAAVKLRHWSLDPVAHTATHLTDVPLVFNSFAKSYIASHACDAAMAAAKVDALVVNIGGDLVVRGDLTETVGITNPQADAENDPPLARIQVHDQTVATSGNYRRGGIIGGKGFSHIVDPRSGHPVAHILSATVVAPNATDAGALATACCVLQPEASLRLVASRPAAECLLLTADGQRIASKGWHSLEAAAVTLATDDRIRRRLTAPHKTLLIDTTVPP